MDRIARAGRPDTAAQAGALRGSRAKVSAPGAGERASPSTLAALRELFEHLSPPRRRALLPLLGLMLLGAFAELLTLGALLPFLAVIAAPETSPILAAIRPILDALGAREPREMLVAATAFFALAALAATLLRLALLRASQRFVYGVAYDLGVALYAGTLAQPYLHHTQRNTSEIVASINKAQLITSELLVPTMQAVVASVIACFIVAGLVIVDPAVALVAGCGFMAVYLAASALTRRRLRHNSTIVARAQEARVRAMQEGLGGIRDILLDRSQSVFVETYARAEADFREARTRNALFAGAPRLIVEGAGMVLIALVAVVVTSRPGGLAEAVPVLGALALGAQRLLPLVQQIYNGWAQANGNKQNLFDILALLRRPVSRQAGTPPALAFHTAIVLDRVGYAYGGGRPAALHEVSLEIPKGARIGIAGRTGSGKSTLVDIVTGLLEPTEGEMRIDGVPVTASNCAAWQRNVAHVPQSIFLADATIAENIAFGARKGGIDMDRVRRAAGQAELGGVVAALPKGYETRVGERGVQLSGGQRQRIGIARALYKGAGVLVLDEATSALDTDTESAVMEAVWGLDRSLTIIVIAHRLSTLRGCDRVVRLDAEGS